jgi:hypothetical protein
MKSRTFVTAAVVAASLAWGGVSTLAKDQKFTEAVTVRGAHRLAMGDYALTFSAPVSLPGLSLRAGTYVFSRQTSGVMRVANERGENLSQLLTIPKSRERATDAYSVEIGDPVAEGAPRRIVAVFEPGEVTGREFIYANR